MYYQFPIYFDYREVKCKALLDMVVVVRNQEGKILNVTGIDLKTMAGNTHKFNYSMFTRRYDIQAAWYSLALADYFAIDLESASMKPFMFVVESTTFVGKPLVYTLAESLLNIGKNGKRAVTLVDTNLFDKLSTNAILKKEILGYEQLLDLYIYHTENGFDEEKEVKEAGMNPLVLDWDGIISLEQ
jgi:hypothetical protein